MSLPEDVDYILMECWIELGRSCAAEITPEALRYWMDHYRPKFIRGMEHPESDWKRDRRNVLEKTQTLGIVAARLALVDKLGLVPGPVTRDVAEQASKLVDCPAKALPYRYCEP